MHETLEAQRQKGSAIIRLLQEQSPAFQLRSRTPGLRSSEALLAGSARRTDGIERASHANPASVLGQIAEWVRPGSTTLETGGGWSTCVFAALAKRHYCVNPDLTANEMIREFLTRHHVPIGELLFLGASSDAALPALDAACVIDVALIDGNHSFPAPIVDWHYIDLHMRRGGVLMLDDTQIRAVGVLCEYLESDPAFRRVASIGHLVIFEKLADRHTWGWVDQAFNRMPPRAARSWPRAIAARLVRMLRR